MDEPEQLQDETNLIDRLLTRASSHATQRLHTFLSEGETEAGHLTYETLDRHARAIAVDLQRKIGEGERALLLYPPGLDFICAFFGCLYAGIVAIPAPLPHRARLQRSLPRLQCLIEDSGTSLVLTDTAHLPELEALAFLAGLSILATDGQPPDEHEAGEWREPCINEDTLAYLQYTSGSTSEPKGVMVRHGDLFRHCGHTARAWGYGPDSVAATWLPHFHDYGLVDGIIQPLFTGIPVYMMSPVAFVVRPERWLKAISHYGVTHSQAPNFGYELCVQRIKPAERERLNLGRWTTASTGAEPVSINTIERFSEVFKQSGFERSAFYPAYGLAEATLLVTTKQHQKPPGALRLDASALEAHEVVEACAGYDQGRTCSVVSCGPPIGETQIAIVDPKTRRRVAAQQVGEIWVSSASMAPGYWQRKEESEHTFRAHLLDEQGEGPFLRTGDLGFIQDGELYVTGRIKDIIIIRGRNHYPQDIELTMAGSHPALRPGFGAAFGLEIGGQERLIVTQEVRPQFLEDIDIADVVGEIREAVSEEHEIQVYDAVLVRAGSIPMTSSGKIQRSECRQRFVEGRLDLLVNTRLVAS